MSTTSDGNTYFCVCFGDEHLKFGVPTAMARKIVESTKKAISKKLTLATIIENSEKAIADAFRKGLHRKPKASKNIAPFIISCCLLSKEALENPEARGFILELSDSMLPARSADANEVVSDDAPGSEKKMLVHYRSMAGREEIDAFVASHRAGAMG